MNDGKALLKQLSDAKTARTSVYLNTTRIDELYRQEVTRINKVISSEELGPEFSAGLGGILGVKLSGKKGLSIEYEVSSADKALLIELHDEILGETGGASGIRDESLLEAALARPINRHLYEGIDDIVELAATYAVAVSSNHPFIDGNKRAAFMALGLFLEINGQSLEAAEDAATDAMLAVASGQWGIEQLGDWLRPNTSAP